MDQVTDMNLDAADLAARHISFVKIGAVPMLEAANGHGPVALETLKQSLVRHKIDLIVEKVESEPVLLELLDQPVDFGQGFLFGEPRLSRES
jgi:cyclic-di-GMP phosphodiesterase TipF (flagellum assembly factor)